MNWVASQTVMYMQKKLDMYSIFRIFETAIFCDLSQHILDMKYLEGNVMLFLLLFVVLTNVKLFTLPTTMLQ